MPRLRVPIWASLAAVASFASRDALAYCRTTNGMETSCQVTAACGCPDAGPAVAWPAGCTGYSLNVQGTSTLTADQVSQAVQQAFSAWMFADCGSGKTPNISILQLRDVDCARSAYDPNGPNVNVVYFDDNGWDPGNGNIDSTLALTTVFSDPGDGRIFVADMALNSGRQDFTVGDTNVQTDLVSVLTHEAGHFIGIAHSPNPSAVMYYSLAPGQTKRALTADDIAAVCAIYPPGPKQTCNPVPPGGLLDTCTTKPSTGCSAAPSSTAPGLGLGAFFVGLLGLGGFRLAKHVGTRWGARRRK